MDGNYNFQLSGAYSKKIQLDSLKYFSYSLQSSFYIDSQINYINEELYRSSDKTINPSITFSYMKEIRQRYSLSYNPRFGINSFSSENIDDTEFVSHNLSLSGITKIWKIYLDNKLSYTYNPSIANGFDKNSFSWNSTLSYSVLDKKGTITFEAYDILNKNVNASHYSTGESVIDIENSVQRRYFMLGFRYRFNTMGKKSPTNNFRTISY